MILIRVCSTPEIALTFQAASEEAKRAKEIMTVAEILSQEIHRVQLIDRLATMNIDESQMADLRSAALDLSSAIMNYLAIAIENLNRGFHSKSPPLMKVDPQKICYKRLLQVPPSEKHLAALTRLSKDITRLQMTLVWF